MKRHALHILAVVARAVTQANIQQTICVRGWAGTIRPPKSYTDNLKNLELGGHPRDTGTFDKASQAVHEPPKPAQAAIPPGRRRSYGVLGGTLTHASGQV